jgi:hypothetical protein
MMTFELKRERPGKKLEPWPKTGSVGALASWKPYAAEGVEGNKSSKSKYEVHKLSSE